MEVLKGKGIFLLVLEKDPGFVQLIRKSLQENSRYSFRVDQAEDFDSAVRNLRDNHYHLLLVEKSFGNVNGLDFLEKLRAEKINVPFVLMTDTRDKAVMEEAESQGVVDFIIKSENFFPDFAAKMESAYEKFCGSKTAFSSFNGMPNLQKDRRSDRLMKEKRDREIQARTHRDELTGVYSHSYLHERLVREFSAAARYQYPLSCLFLDLDHFRDINEKHGFQVGDIVLRKCAELLFSNCRMSDIIARYGGEKFVILLPHTGYNGAMNLSLRLRQLLLNHEFSAGEAMIPVSASIGVASYPDDKIQKRFELMSFATQAALRSKALGGNRVSRYKDTAPILGDDLLKLKLGEDKIDSFRKRMVEISEAARRSYLEVSRMLIEALEQKDGLTAGHSEAMARYAVETAVSLGLSTEDAEVVYHAAVLHDVGKLCIPDEILTKKGKLTFQEYETMKQHPYLGYQILKPVKFLQAEAVLVLHHHEWFNGMGYPAGLKGEKIPLGARIISVLDAYDMLIASGSRYKKTLSSAEALKELTACAGTQFDPAVVKAFAAVLEKKEREFSSNGQRQRSSRESAA